MRKRRRSNQGEKRQGVYEELIPNYDKRGVLSPRQRSLANAANALNKNGLTNPSTSVYCLLLGTQRGEKDGPVPSERLQSSLRRVKTDTFSKGFAKQSHMGWMPGKCARVLGEAVG